MFLYLNFRSKLLFAVLLVLPVISYAQKQGKARVDSLLAELPHAKDDTNKVKVLNALSYVLCSIDPDKGIDYGKEGLKLAEELSWKSGIASANRSLGVNCMGKAEFQAAINYALKALATDEALANKRGISLDLGNVAQGYMGMGNYTTALDYLLRGLKLAEEIGDKGKITLCQVNIANVYTRMQEYDKGLEHYILALKMNEEAGDKLNQGRTTLSIGANYYSQKKYKESLEYFEKALHLLEPLGDKEGIQTAIGNAGSAYRDLGNYGKALEYEARSLGLSRELGLKDAEAIALNETGLVYLQLMKTGGGPANSGKAIDYLRQAAALAEAIQMNDLLIEVYKNLADACALAGRYKDALDYHVRYTVIKDSIYSTDNKVKIAQLGTQRETELKEKQIEINRLQGHQKTRERVIFIFGIGLAAIIIVLILDNYRKQRRSNAALANANASQATANKHLETEKQKSDLLAASLQETIVHKDELAAQLVIASEMKSKFLANMSHELRTPVTLFTGMLELMKDKKGQYAPEDQEKMNIAYSNSRKLQAMVEEILDLSKLERRNGNIGEQQVNKETVAVAPLVKRMVYAFETYIQKEGLSLEFDDAGAADLYIQADEQLFEKIINNLVYNAIKFNKRGGRIAVAIKPSADRESAVLTISDTGSGISAADQPHIFERFYQGSGQAAAATAQGMGIGLSLVKEFTGLHGGTVTVASEYGAGATFTLTFPAVGIPQQKSTVAQGGDEGVALAENWSYFAQRPTVLLVEDNQEMRYYLRTILGGSVAMAEAANGKEALAWLENNKADLVISDIMMPEMDGRELIARLKDTEAYKKIPVITLSALADKESQLELLRLGIDDYIVKPFNAVELRVRVYNLLYNYAERLLFNQQPAEPDDIAADSREGEEFRSKITAYVLGRLKSPDITVADLAGEFCLSERQLSRLAKNLTGCSPAQLVKEVRLQKAYELLLSGDIYKVEDVARRVGFEAAGYFARQFAERFGKRPTEFL